MLRWLAIATSVLLALSGVSVAGLGTVTGKEEIQEQSVTVPWDDENYTFFSPETHTIELENDYDVEVPEDDFDKCDVGDEFPRCGE